MIHQSFSTFALYGPQDRDGLKSDLCNPFRIVNWENPAESCLDPSLVELLIDDIPFQKLGYRPIRVDLSRGKLTCESNGSPANRDRYLKSWYGPPLRKMLGDCKCRTLHHAVSGRTVYDVEINPARLRIHLLEDNPSDDDSNSTKDDSP